MPLVQLLLLLQRNFFYKVYAWPGSDTIYRVFTCPVWSITITGSITLDTSTTKQQYNFTLHPPHQHVGNSIEMALIAPTVPILPVLASYLITDGSAVSKVEAPPAGMLVTHSVGQLRCTSEESANSSAPPKNLVMPVFFHNMPVHASRLRSNMHVPRRKHNKVPERRSPETTTQWERHCHT
ncbi:unnamed protein product [Nippostrongylus brasiliensis]|uniref:Phlebovirus_G2 domain-containing protein n=1 Tax=Nippostrongylus brasiliensis TaxID=27835 RepID=A0A0N4YSJ2_NIPBR|nr:unnamed protein product [Nippostrongylus brasiliensis]